MTNLAPDSELRALCRQIRDEQLTETEWAERESDDMFQTRHYSGGYDADERAFCFSHYGSDGRERWFQLSLVEIEKVAEGLQLTVPTRMPE